MRTETPHELYARLEARLSPLLRRMLARHLPAIAGTGWWEICVVNALTPVQRDNMRPERTLEQFDFPALVNIVYRNWRSLRHSLRIGNEFTNYLFTLKTFRNDVEHQPDLVLGQARRRHLEEAARLAESLLEGGSADGDVPGGRRCGRLAAVGACAVLLAAGAAFFLAREDAGPSPATDFGAAAAQTAGGPDAGEGAQEDVAIRLRKMTAYSAFVEKGIFEATDFNANYDGLTARIRRIQQHFGMPETGIPDDELLALFRQDRVPEALMRAP